MFQGFAEFHYKHLHFYLEGGRKMWPKDGDALFEGLQNGSLTSKGLLFLNGFCKMVEVW